jgi:GT2 family glycosyltransferase/glycosyltransferase involved in cell wall biosynthesis
MKKLANELIEVSIKKGNDALRVKNYASAMSIYIQMLGKYQELDKVLASNIKLTQIFFKKSENLEPLIIRSRENTVDKEQFDKVIETINSSIQNTKLNCDKDQIFVAKEVENHKQKERCIDLIYYACENPASVIYIDKATPFSLMLGFLYSLIWGAKVKVHDELFEFLPIDKFISEFTEVKMLTQMAISVDEFSANLVCLLGNNLSVSSKNSKINWPKNYTCLEEIYKKLAYVDDYTFLTELFDHALGREPKEHEKKHYLDNLKNPEISRFSIIETIFDSEESITYLKNILKKNLQHKNKYRNPELDEINLADIELPYYSNPLVSILIPVYQKLEYTLACLKSISENLPNCTFEILILDDRSLDGSPKEIKKIKNIHVIENPENLGFLKSCNNGAKHANGEYLFFLNNDTQVKPGWLDELIMTFDNFPGCGLVGSKLIFPDGTLQEAGGIIWKDGSAWNYGRGDNPNKPEYNYAREVDYCSGAAILVNKNLFFELGCFDERYAPAYCEDSDFALTVRDAGYRVIYQPMSEVVHFEGVSSGKDLTVGVKAYQVTNTTKQFNKWRHNLSKHRETALEPYLERDRGVIGRVLFIDACTPTPDKDSGSIDTFNLMLMFRELGYVVSFIPEDNFAFIDGYTQNLQKNGFYTIYHPYANTIQEHLEKHGESYDLIMIFRPKVALRSIDAIRKLCINAKIIFNTVDLHFLRLEREAALFKNKEIAIEAADYKKIEFDIFDKADISTVISSFEYEILKNLKESLSIFHLPYSRGVSKNIKNFENRTGVIFVGSFNHPPNKDAIKYFVNEIWPIVIAEDKNAVLHIVGSDCTDDIRQLASKNIVVHGYVEDLAFILQTVKVNIVPLRYGAGIKGKLGGAMAAGLPSVSTIIGAEGMSIKDNSSGVLIAKTEHEFAESILLLLNDKLTWERLSKSSLNFSIENWGYIALYTRLKKLLKLIGRDLPTLKREVKLL